jgi:Domain of unknown function (DUF4148)
MNFTRTLGSLLLLAAFGTHANAQLTREQVKAELAEAIRTGNVLADGESGLMRNQIDPGRYPAKPMLAGKTREQVKAELAEAIRTGDMPAGGESGLMLYEMYPQRYAKARGSNPLAGSLRSPSAAAAAASAALAR